MKMQEYKLILAQRNRDNATHRMTGTVEYKTWSSMKNRCYRVGNKQYHDYGGRGIKVCDRWLNSFETFYADMGPRPDGCSLDRIDNDGNYEPSNCRWATKHEQATNRTDSRIITYNNKSMTVADWAIELKNPQIYNRLHRGWDIVRALSTPYKERKNAKKQRL